jgi:hypothetical protein
MEGHSITSIFFNLGCLLTLLNCLAALCFTLIDFFGKGKIVCKGFAVIVFSSLELGSSTPTDKRNQFTC